ncbi:MAG: bifunctional methylenetetrahydrofolate dehydrogenase/methenyltetrahydrofolate cyclohydrolase FolD [Spirochaetaceae bacterium]|nr:MAG: bifunctional methylenetetrahydrofolate dehydrogenase/methenyltetrahydrofolate cyclohydrolase FolD [Spirochaetaceae bacterium]
MGAQILDGKITAAAIRAEIAREVSGLSGRKPGLGVILVGDNPASLSYVKGKEKACEEAGMTSREIRLPADASREDVVGAVESLNAAPEIDGILVQLPLPGHLNESEILARIAPDKDVDGLHVQSLGALLKGEPTYIPCTPYGVAMMLSHNGISVSGKHVVIVGRSTLVGKSLANLLLRKGDGGDATVTVCHSRTPDLRVHTRQADILVAAIGRPNTITSDMVSPGTVVIDVGVNRVDDASKKRGYRLVGDVDYEAVSGIASAITPVPGGVGPMTITMLLKNTLEAAKIHMKQEGRAH